MVTRLIEILERQLRLRCQYPAREQRLMEYGVDLVERQPVFYLLPIARKDRAHVPLVEADEVMTHPAVVCFGKVERRLVVRDRDERLDAVSQENTSLTVLLYPYVDRIDAYKKMRQDGCAEFISASLKL